MNFYVEFTFLIIHFHKNNKKDFFCSAVICVKIVTSFIAATENHHEVFTLFI